MFHSLEIEGFRSFRHCRVSDLRRVNLFVGGNNSGKTTILEGIEILLGAPLWTGPERRGENVEEERRDRVCLAHLFHGYRFHEGSQLTLSASGEKDISLSARIVPYEGDEMPENDGEYVTSVRIDWQGRETVDIPLLDFGAVPMSTRMRSRRRRMINDDDQPNLTFLGTQGLTESSMRRLWDMLVVTPEENIALDTLRIVEPQIERIAAVGGRTGFVAKLKDVEQRIPLGSLGDGVRRLLTLAVCFARSKSAALLVDEIDTGLHHSTLAAMWRMAIEASRRLGTQVFATTHSLDCIHAIADVHKVYPDLARDVAVYRVEPGCTEPTQYSAEDIVEVSEQAMEIR